MEYCPFEQHGKFRPFSSHTCHESTAGLVQEAIRWTHKSVGRISLIFSIGIHVEQIRVVCWETNGKRLTSLAVEEILNDNEVHAPATRNVGASQITKGAERVEDAGR